MLKGIPPTAQPALQALERGGAWAHSVQPPTFQMHAASVYMSFEITCGRAQQVPMQPTMEPARVKMQEKPAEIIIARKQLSIVLMSLQSWTVVVKW